MLHSKELLNFKYIRDFQLAYPHSTKYSPQTLRQIFKGMIEEITNVLLLQPNGMIIDGLGYFACSKKYEPYMVRYGDKLYANDYSITIDFFPEVFKYFKLYGYVFKPSVALTTRLYKEIDNRNIQYVNHIKLLKKINPNGNGLGFSHLHTKSKQRRAASRANWMVFSH